MLDGGHLLFFVIEGILGRPVSLRKREAAQQLGLVLLLLLMVFATMTWSGSTHSEFSDRTAP
jgi:regulator of sigma E protease